MKEIVECPVFWHVAQSESIKALSCEVESFEKENAKNVLGWCSLNIYGCVELPYTDQ